MLSMVAVDVGEVVNTAEGDKSKTGVCKIGFPCILSGITGKQAVGRTPEAKAV